MKYGVKSCKLYRRPVFLTPLLPHKGTGYVERLKDCAVFPATTECLKLVLRITWPGRRKMCAADSRTGVHAHEPASKSCRDATKTSAEASETASVPNLDLLCTLGHDLHLKRCAQAVESQGVLRAQILVARGVLFCVVAGLLVCSAAAVAAVYTSKLIEIAVLVLMLLETEPHCLHDSSSIIHENRDDHCITLLFGPKHRDQVAFASIALSS